MAFIKKASLPQVANDGPENSLAEDLSKLSDENADTRRHAVHDLAAFPEAVQPLCDRLALEQDVAVRTTILTALIKIGVPQAVECLIPYLGSENVALRNDVIVALQQMQQLALPLVEKLLENPDTDIRIFAINILAGIHDLHVPALLMHVIEHDSHINVWSAAIEAIAEIGTPEMVPAIQASLQRFDTVYARFAVQFAVQRING
ncbi:MAG TPA: HEAT repeat domain-containing protein [Methylophilaceae bacterium]|nr:HEAT repeat domain-containing protein [Methylophilaceae bacterium]